MKYLALSALSFSLCLAQENAPVETPAEEAPAIETEAPAAVVGAPSHDAVAEALAQEAKPYLESARRHIDLLRKLRDVLKGVADLETANAAAAEVDALALQVKQAMEQEQELPEPGPEVQYLVSAETASLDLEELTNESIGRAIELQEMETPGYGSGAMEQALDALLSLYLQEEDEEPQEVEGGAE